MITGLPAVETPRRGVSTNPDLPASVGVTGRVAPTWAGEAITVVSALAQGSARLQRVGVETPLLEARALLENCLGLTRVQLYCQPERRLTADEAAVYFATIARREAREPLAYVLGRREFYGLDLLTDRRALIPRPETEILVEEAVRHIGDRSAIVADVGTGSGAIAVSLAVNLPLVRVYGLDISTETLQLAAQNCRRHEVEDRVTLLQGDLLSPLPEPSNLIVANLPYVSSAEMRELPPEVRREPQLALAGGEDGLDLIRRLLRAAPGCLLPAGALVLEIGARQGLAASALARESFPEATVRLLRDYAGLDRVLVVETGKGR